MNLACQDTPWFLGINLNKILSFYLGLKDTLSFLCPTVDFDVLLYRHEVVGEVVEVGSEVTNFRVGDVVGVGVIVGCCRNCNPCKSDVEQYCNKKIWSYNDVYTDGKTTQGGFAQSMIVDQKFVVKIPDGMSAEQAAPLLCAGLTVYSPLSHFGLNKSGLRGGILGLGGVGHMGVKIAKAMGHHVTVISSSDKKRAEAMEHLGADEYLVSSDATRMQEFADTLDYIIDTVPAVHALEPYLSLLKLDGRLILMGVINAPLQFLTPLVMLGEFLPLCLSPSPRPPSLALFNCKFF
ncbi:hypothetical protein P3X46_013818 [Hevea brasiliensis]|uniref:Enoyl reductase (ER) domain-containing protein n=1 Tax=Hevea brasiliensis TaxID=3981 RepID=A0ABQ9M4P8_HEVBR|nr:hypothetical protein P3X46_013818 [Hevea brasiliensis]